MPFGDGFCSRGCGRPALTTDGWCGVCSDATIRAAVDVHRPHPESAAVLTPYELGVLLHYYGRADRCDREDAQCFWDVLRKFEQQQMMTVTWEARTGKPFQPQLTPRGRAYIDSLLRVPLPEAVWVTRWPQP